MLRLYLRITGRPWPGDRGCRRSRVCLSKACFLAPDQPKNDAPWSALLNNEAVSWSLSHIMADCPELVKAPELAMEPAKAVATESEVREMVGEVED